MIGSATIALDFYNPRYKIKRSHLFTSLVVYPCLSSIANLRYKIHFNNLDNLLPLKNQGFILLPKHQSAVDIVVEGMTLKKAINRYANYLMTVRVPYILENHDTLNSLPYLLKVPIKAILRPTLPKMLEMAGGIGIIRKKDLNHRSEVYYAQRRKLEIYDEELPNLLCRDEICVVHPECEMKYKKDTDARSCRPTLEKLLKLQKRIRRNITFVPLDILYENIFKFGSDAEVTVGKPIIVPSTDKGLEDLIAYLRDNITLMH